MSSKKLESEEEGQRRVRNEKGTLTKGTEKRDMSLPLWSSSLAAFRIHQSTWTHKMTCHYLCGIHFYSSPVSTNQLRNRRPKVQVPSRPSLRSAASVRPLICRPCRSPRPTEIMSNSCFTADSFAHSLKQSTYRSQKRGQAKKGVKRRK